MVGVLEFESRIHAPKACVLPGYTTLRCVSIVLYSPLFLQHISSNFLVRVTGLEPVTPTFRELYSAKLNYTRLFFLASLL